MATKQVEVSWQSEVLQADPEWWTKYRTITEYKFSNGREFDAVYNRRGAYGPEYDE